MDTDEEEKDVKELEVEAMLVALKMKDARLAQAIAITSLLGAQDVTKERRG